MEPCDLLFVCLQILNGFKESVEIEPVESLGARQIFNVSF